MNVPEEKGEAKWLLDSACTRHITGTISDLKGCEEFPENDNSSSRYVTLADGSVVRATGQGNLNVYLRDDSYNRVPVTFKNVLHVPNMKRLISVGQLTRPETGAEVTFKGNEVVLKVNGKRFVFGTREGKLYEMNYCYFAAVPEKKTKRKSKRRKPKNNRKRSSVERIQNKEAVGAGHVDLKWEYVVGDTVKSCVSSIEYHHAEDRNRRRDPKDHTRPIRTEDPPCSEMMSANSNWLFSTEPMS